MSARMAVAALVLAAGGVLVAAGVAAAEPAPDCTTTDLDQTAAEVPLPAGWNLVVDCGPRPAGVAGVADSAARTVTVWPDAHHTADQMRWTYLHEAGHTYDMTYWTPQQREAWRMLRGLPADADWWHAPDLDAAAATLDTWASSPAEDMAETFAGCAVGVVAAERAECRMVRALLQAEGQS